MRLGHDLVADPRIQRPGQRRVQQRPRIIFPQPPDHQLGQPRQVTGRDTGPEHQADRLRPQPARDEREDLRRGAVEPLLVIDDAHQRPVPGHLGQQAQGGQADQEPVRRQAGAEAERGPQRVALRRRQTVQVVQHRRAQLVQRRERQLHLRLDAPRVCYPAARRLPGQVLQQRGLAHPRLAVHHESAAFTRTHSRHQSAEHVAFRVAVGQARHRPSPGNSAGTRTVPTLYLLPVKAVSIPRALFNMLTRKLGPAGRAAADPGRCGGGAGDGCWFVRRSGRDAGAGGSSWGLVVRRLAGQAPGGKAASGAGSGDGLMVMVTVQPGWSFWIWRSSQAWRCPGDSRRV